ncbi:MAG: SHOCT domain-containing protein [Bacilli bacterium]|nr:SHOCT domain-containing protein [Bacilli bacterium]
MEGSFGGKPVSKADELKKFKSLYDDGAITLEEYEQKKRELL